MKKKTYCNFLKAMKIVESKGYNKEEAESICHKVFDEHQDGAFTIEHWLDQIITKAEWIEQQKLYGRM